MAEKTIIKAKEVTDYEKLASDLIGGAYLQKGEVYYRVDDRTRHSIERYVLIELDSGFEKVNEKTINFLSELVSKLELIITTKTCAEEDESSLVNIIAPPKK